MLTNDEYKNRIIALTQNSEQPVHEMFQQDIDLISHHGINDYKTLLDSINRTDLPVELRTAVCWLTARVGDTDSLPVLLLATNDESAAVRRQAIQALGELGISSPSILDTIIRALSSDSDEEVRKASAYALGLLAHHDTLTPLLHASNNTNESPSVRGMAIEALISLREHSVIPLLIDLLSDEAAEVRFWSSFALGQLGAQEALPELERLAKEDEVEVSGWYNVSQEAADAIKIIKNAGNNA